MADPFVSRDRSSALFTDEKCIRGAISDAGQPLLGDPARRGVAWTTQRRQQARGIERQVIGTIPKVVTSVLMCARVRFFYCFASDDLDQTAELVEIGRQPRCASGDAAGQPLPAAALTLTAPPCPITRRRCEPIAERPATPPNWPARRGPRPSPSSSLAR